MKIDPNNFELYFFKFGPFFWDSVECGCMCRLYNVQVVTVNSVSELYRYIDQKQLSADFHGSLKFNHRDWIQQQQV